MAEFLVSLCPSPTLPRPTLSGQGVWVHLWISACVYPTLTEMVFNVAQSLERYGSHSAIRTGTNWYRLKNDIFPEALKAAQHAKITPTSMMSTLMMQTLLIEDTRCSFLTLFPLALVLVYPLSVYFCHITALIPSCSQRCKKSWFRSCVLWTYYLLAIPST